MVGAQDRGQALPLVALVLALAGLAAVAIGRIGEAAVQRAQARAAADAAALAAALDGEAAARGVTEANGATLVRVERKGPDVRAVVAFGRARATARARASGGTGPRGPGTVGLAPAMRAALARARELLGQEVPVTSGYRSPQEQAALYRQRGSNAYPVAPPGRSLHEHGLAIDVPLAFVPRLLPVAPLAGLCRPYPVTDPVHFELCRRGP